VAPDGTPVVAAAAGRVTAAGTGSPSAGLAVVIEHAGSWWSFYCHLSRILVHAGELVLTGDTIAEVGHTGNAEGPHLHTELSLAGHAVDPVPLYAWPRHRGLAALWLQGRLTAHGYDPGPIDGIAGPRTIEALYQFQTDRHLDAGRYVDPATYHALRLAAR